MIANHTPLYRHLRGWLMAVIFTALGLYVAWPWLAKGPHTRTIVFYGFSILGEAMNEAVFPAFRDEWRARTGEEVEFISSFGGSGTVTNQILMGVPAEVALLSLELDAHRIAGARIVPAEDWRRLPQRGVLNRTPFIILVRPGNPKNIRDFADLARPGIAVVHPDPFTSGGANWAILAEYGAAARGPGGKASGEQMLLGIWQNVVAQAASARAARTQFENGFGDALITYEQEAIWDRLHGKLHAEIVYPRSTILSEHTLVVIDRNIKPKDREMVAAFVEFLWSEKAQRLFAQSGFRSVDEHLNADFRKIDDAFRVDDFGGWKEAKREIIETIWKGRVLKQLRH